MKAHSIFALAIIALLVGTAAEAKYCGGTGEPNDPYRICTAEDMNQIGANPADWNKHFILVNDVNLAQYTGTQFKIIGNSTTRFTGVFDGNDHKVWNFTWTSGSSIGLFGYVGTGGQIKNLGMENVNVNAGLGSNVGGLVAYNGGTITNCYSTGKVTGGTGSGGLVGYNYGGTITNSYFTGDVNGTASGYNSGVVVGGLVALNAGTITNCYSTGNVNGKRVCFPPDNYIGGLVARNYGTITKCYSTSKVTGTGTGCGSNKLYVGGLVGANYGYGMITNCYSTGNVNGTGSDNWNYAGGLVGYNEVGEGMITYCYSTGSVSISGAHAHSFVGGLVGYGGGVVSSFWNIETSGRNTSAGGAHKTTAEMKMASTYIGWGGCDNNDIWTINNGYDYPHLAWEGKPGQLIPEQYLSDYVTGGSGEPNDPYLISTAWQFNLIGAFPCEWDKHFKLVSDINIADYDGTQFNIIGGKPSRPFTGVFDGNDHKVLNFTWDSNGVIYVGLFSYVDGSGQIKNVGLENVNINTANGDYIGGFVGDNNGGTIINCYSTGNVSVTSRSSYFYLYIGGLVGDNEQGTITSCYSTGSVSGEGSVGGLVGDNEQGTITNCYSTSSVSGEGSVGGLVGANQEGGTITDCYATGNVSGATYGGMCSVGGLVGDNYSGTITGCYATGNVSGAAYGGVCLVGGLVAVNSGTVTNCYSTSSVSGGSGLVGSNSGTITNCYSTGSVSGNSGLVGGNSGTITNCYSTGSVSGRSGLVGTNSGTITNCHSTGSVIGGTGSGGLVGDNSGTITNCYSDANVSGVNDVGGLVGDNSGTIMNCYSMGNVSGTSWIGGLVGDNSYYSTITNCYSDANVIGDDYVGGLVGQNGYCDPHSGYYPGYTYNCYSVGAVIGDSNVGGLVGENLCGEVNDSFWDVNTSGQTSSDGGTGKTTEEMKTRSTFTDAGWDFVCETANGTDEVWTIKEGVDYPKLVWQCFKDYQEWIDVNKPPCWVCPRQCHGDSDNTSEYIKGKGYYYVHFKDMGQLLSAWNVREPPQGPGIKWPAPNICADFDHDKEYIKGKGYYRVHFKDMGILLANWNVKEPPDGPGIDPNCNCLDYCP